MGGFWSNSSSQGASSSYYEPPPRPPTPPKELEDKPWREEQLVYSSSYEKQLREQMERQFTGDKIKRANILLLGPIKAGKSSFLNSVASICKDRIAKIVRTGDAEKSLTTKYGQFAPKTGIMKNFCLLDCMGLEREGEGFNVDEVCFLVNGNVPKNYQFNPRSPITENDPRFIKYPKKQDKVHCVVIVIDAEALYGELPAVIKQRIKDLKTRLDLFEIQQVVVLTKIDKLCRKVDEDIANVYRSVKVHQMVKVAAELFGLPQNQIFPLKNYSEETTLNFKLNIPILLALRMMITMADDYIENQDDEDDD